MRLLRIGWKNKRVREGKEFPRGKQIVESIFFKIRLHSRILSWKWKKKFDAYESLSQKGFTDLLKQNSFIENVAGIRGGFDVRNPVTSIWISCEGDKTTKHKLASSFN